MKSHSTAPLLVMCLAVSHPATPGLYIDVDSPVEHQSGTRTVDVVVGNRGDVTNHENFDAFLEVRTKSEDVCRATTNFVTPIAPGQLVRAFRFELRPSDPQTLERFTVRASIHYWDEKRGGFHKDATWTLPSGRGSCIALKPPQ